MFGDVRRGSARFGEVRRGLAMFHRYSNAWSGEVAEHRVAIGGVVGIVDGLVKIRDQG